MDAGRGRAVGVAVSYVDLEARVGKDHPLRTIRCIVNEALAALSGEFSALYARMGRPSIPQRSFCGRCCCRRSIRGDESAFLGSRRRKKRAIIFRPFEQAFAWPVFDLAKRLARRYKAAGGNKLVEPLPKRGEASAIVVLE